MSTAAEHARSYYAATATRRTDCPRLQGAASCDVAVVGAGYTGLSAAIALAERGYQVIVIEANRVGWGASGRNGGQLIDGFVELGKIERRLGLNAREIAYRMGLECRDLVLERIERYAIDCDLKFGFLELAIKRAELERFREEIEQKRRLGYPHELRLVGREEMPVLIGSSRYIGGLVSMANGHLHP
ncbi:MAG: NAD(P)/FAD-dependent oxidoreductase, partial [Woeseiaceae bacterium]